MYTYTYNKTRFPQIKVFSIGVLVIITWPNLGHPSAPEVSVQQRPMLAQVGTTWATPPTPWAAPSTPMGLHGRPGLPHGRLS